MKLQELVNKLSNMLAGGAGEADVKIDDKFLQTVTFAENQGIKSIVLR